MLKPRKNKGRVNKIRNRVGYITRDSYNKMVESDKYKTFVSKTGHEISYEQYISCLKESNKEIANQILSNELGFKIPHNLGYIAVTKFKQRDTYRVVDWKNTEKLGKEIPILNLHSLGYMFKIQFFKNKSIRSLRAYFFHGHRHLKRALAAKIKGGKYNYISLDYTFFNKKFRIDNIFKNLK